MQPLDSARDWYGHLPEWAAATVVTLAILYSLCALLLPVFVFLCAGRLGKLWDVAEQGRAELRKIRQALERMSPPGKV